MKNVFWLFSVCTLLLIYACSSDSKSDRAETSTNEENTRTELVDQGSEPSSTLPTETVASVTEIETEPQEETTSEEQPEPKLQTEKEAVKEVKPTQVTPTPKPTAPVTIPVAEPSKPQPASPAQPAPKPPKAATQPKPAASTPKPETTPPPPKVEAPQPQLSHDVFDKMLKSYVSSSGQVDYAAFKKNIGQLEGYLEHLEAFPPQSGWSTNKKLAYWFNLYNAWTIKTVADQYPVSSITKIDGGGTWKVKRVKSGTNTYSLDEVENAIIRPRFKDARIHFAVNCAAKSCPPLLNKAWTESNTASYLEKQTKAFVNDTAYNEISNKKIRISKIFEWYAEDFGDIITYLNRYSNTTIDQKAKIEYIEYDWNLNGK